MSVEINNSHRFEIQFKCWLINLCFKVYFKVLYDNALRKLYGDNIDFEKKKKKIQEKVPFKFWTRDSIKRSELNQGTGNSIIKFHEISRSRSARIDFFFLSLSLVIFENLIKLHVCFVIYTNNISLKAIMRFKRYL